MKKISLYICKCFVAAIISLIVLSLFSAVYFNPPVAIEQPDGTTNYRYIPGQSWSYMLEGYGNGKIDNFGYNNAYYKDLSDPDIVFAGSSHLEGLQVPEEANCVYLLNEMFDKDDLANNNFKCLNLGVSGHFFEVTSSNYQYIAEKYKDAKYIIIEVFDAKYSPDVLDKIIEDKFREPIEKRGFLGETLRKVPYFKLMYKKINEALSAGNSADIVEGNGEVLTDKESELNSYTEKMNVILDEISKTSAQYNIKPIILMHERFFEDKDGKINLEMDETYKKAFKECCENNNLNVIDVSSDMVSEYEKTLKPSYGFSNTASGEGHLNKTGHRIIAETIYKYINEMEGLR